MLIRKVTTTPLGSIITRSTNHQAPFHRLIARSSTLCTFRRGLEFSRSLAVPALPLRPHRAAAVAGVCRWRWRASFTCGSRSDLGIATASFPRPLNVEIHRLKRGTLADRALCHCHCMPRDIFGERGPCLAYPSSLAQSSMPMQGRTRGSGSNGRHSSPCARRAIRPWPGTALCNLYPVVTRLCPHPMLIRCQVLDRAPLHCLVAHAPHPADVDDELAPMHKRCRSADPRFRRTSHISVASAW
jgi:hypothetical protein